MKTFTGTMAFLAAASISSVALAAPGDAHYGKETRAQQQTSDIEAQTSDVSLGVDTNAALVPSVEASRNNPNRADFMQNQLN